LPGISPARVKKIRKALDFSQEDFAHILWVTWTTVNRWETGAAEPYGIHLRILQLLEQRLPTRSFRSTLLDPRAGDPMFLLFRLLEPVYQHRPARGRRRPVRVSAP
jgi:DNA-binding XRE family transcriptional regulator